MKNLAITMLLATALTSCGKLSSGGSRGERIKMGDALSPSDLPDTKYVKADPISCLLKVALVELPMTVIETILIDGIMGSHFDITISEDLSRKIVYELKNHVSKFGKISPSQFWLALTKETRLELHTLLLNRYVTSSDEHFDDIRRVVSYSFMVFLENEDYTVGYKMRYQNKDKVETRLRIGFSDAPKERVDVGVCNDVIVKNISIPKDMMRPSDIKTRISCNNKNGKLKIDAYSNGTMKVDYTVDEVENSLELDSTKFEYEDRKKKRIYNYEVEDLDLKMTIKKDYTFKEDSNKKIWKDDSIDELDLIIKNADGKVKMKNLECQVTKPFVIIPAED